MINPAKKAELELEDDAMMPGFRFRPTDEELVCFYLRRIVQRKPLAIALITQLDIHKYDPWELPKMAANGERECYFFCPRVRKYRNSNRPNRVTGAGFWKATGTDKPIYAADGTHCVGLKKSLVFYKGRATRGLKTEWMMHEFRLPSCNESNVIQCEGQEDTWAIYKIFKKNTHCRSAYLADRAAEQNGETTSHQNLDQEPYESSYPRAAYDPFPNNEGTCLFAAPDPLPDNNNGPRLLAQNSLKDSNGSSLGQLAVQNSLQEKNGSACLQLSAQDSVKDNNGGLFDQHAAEDPFQGNNNGLCIVTAQNSSHDNSWSCLQLVAQD